MDINNKHILLWPDNIYDVCEIDDRQLAWLLEGLDIHQARAHKKLKYTTKGYDGLEKLPGVYLVGCWTHVRRKFMEVVKAAGKGKTGHAQTVLDYRPPVCY